MSFSIPVMRSFLIKSSNSGGSNYNYSSFCNSFGGGSQPDYFLLNGVAPTISLTTPVDVTFLYTVDLAQLVADYPGTTIGYEWYRAGPSCLNTSGSGTLTADTTVTITNPCEDDQTVDLYIKVYNSAGWVNPVCCIPYGQLCPFIASSFVQAYYTFDIQH